MTRSYDYWLTAAYRAAPPALAQDALPTSEIVKVLANLAKRWIKRFDDWAPKLAEIYASSQFKATDAAFRRALKDAGWSVEFKQSKAMRDALAAHTAENIALIKSIPQQFHGKVEQIVLRSYSAGHDLKTMSDNLAALYPAAENRAALIARDQTAKANGIAQRARQIDLGIKEAIWKHSHAGKKPRADHVEANGKRYNVAEGCYISGEYIYPGEMINCRCGSRSILPFEV